MTVHEAIQKKIIWKTAGDLWHRKCGKCGNIVDYRFNRSYPWALHKALKCGCWKCNTGGKQGRRWEPQLKANTSEPITETKQANGTQKNVTKVYGGRREVGVTVYEVALVCKCGWKDKRGVPALPWRIKWICKVCGQNYCTTFE